MCDCLRHKARLRNARRSRTKTQNPHTGTKQAWTISVEGRPEASVVTYAPSRHRDALHRQMAALNPRSALRGRPRDEDGPREARVASLHRLVSQVPEQRQDGSSKASEGLDIGTKGRAEDTCRYACRLQASRAAAAIQGVRAAPPAKDAAAGWMT
jgi:hypothetical protein